jgi:single-strand DNA-binding protein
MTMNKTILIGYLGQAPELHDQDTKPRAVASLATSEFWKNRNTDKYDEKTEWHRLVIWGRAALYFAELRKGDQVAIEGKITYYDTEKDGAKVRYTNIVVLTWKRLNKRHSGNAQGKVEEASREAQSA